MKAGDEVWVKGYIKEKEQEIPVSCSGTLLETPAPRSRSVLVGLDNYYGEQVVKKVFLKYIHLL